VTVTGIRHGSRGVGSVRYGEHEERSLEDIPEALSVYLLGAAALRAPPVTVPIQREPKRDEGPPRLVPAS
jgi:hypothetical protein